MKKRNLFILVLIISLQFKLAGQSCIGTVHLDSKAVCVTNIVSLEKPVQLKQLDDALSSRGDIQLFYKYYNTSSYEEYKNIYPPSDWYGLSEEDYNSWMDYMRTLEINIESVVLFIENNITYSCIQFYIISEGFYDRVTFLSKKINNFWYPSSQKEEESFAYEKGFFRCVRPQLLEYLLENKESAMTRSNGKTQMLREKVMEGNDLNARALLMDRKAVASFRSDDYRTLYFNLEERLDPETWYNEDRINDAKFISYMDSLQAPVDKQQEIIRLIKNLKYITAAARLAKFQGIDSNTPVHTSAIKRIYGDNRLIEIIAKPENE